MTARARRPTAASIARRIVAADPAFAEVVRSAPASPLGDPTQPRHDDHFEALVRSIVFQQLAGAAASAIHGRLVVHLEGITTPEAILELPDDAWRTAGVSRSKERSLVDLAGKVLDGTVPLDHVADLDDDEVVAHLTQVRGIGPWTAQMFLMFRLGRPDVWPTGDLGVRNGWGRIHGLTTAPTPRELADLGAPFAPYRSTVAWYCWRGSEMDLGGVTG